MRNAQEDSLGFLVHDVARMLRWNFDRKAQGLELTRSQWSVLAHLQRCEGIQQKRLAGMMGMTAISLTGLLDRLERNGWVQRRDDPADRRAKRVYLTGKVTPVLADIRVVDRDVREQALLDFSDAEREQLICYLQRLRGNLSR